MLLCLRGVALRWIELGALDFGCVGLNVSIYDEMGWQLLVVVLEGQLVITLFRHLYPSAVCPIPQHFG